MEMTTQTAQSQLCHKLVGDIRGIFFVPRYQRGYRWDSYDVQRLLDDIWASKGQDYSLQPIVVKRCKKIDDEQNYKWELIDGQQRLTTLYLIFHYMQIEGWKKMGAPYSISYQTRPGSTEYLRTLDPVERNKNIDYFHIYQAYERIGQWFQGKGDAYVQEDVVSTFYGFLFKSVRVIWYEAPVNVDDDEKDSTALFTRLNVGRILLTDAELVKALLLSGVRKIQAERAQEIAAQWDVIERDLNHPDIWAFIAGADTGDDADKYPTRINLLLDTIAYTKDKVKGKRPRYHTFDTLRGEIKADAKKFWDQVVELHALILGWFSDHQLYNKIGFLVAANNSFCEIVDLSKKQGKKAFEKKLNELICNKIGISKSELLNLSYDKRSDHPKLLNILLLMNVETVSRTGQRFPFSRHVGKTWSLEHIHAQNAGELTEKKQWNAWLEAHMQALHALSTKQEVRDTLVQDIKTALQGIDTVTNFGPTFQSLAARVIAVFNEHTALETSTSNNDVHSICNLALLSRDDNSALSNEVFEVKRQIIIGLDRRGDYIPICTRNVFLKYYTGADAQQIHFWSPQDKESYINAIISTLKKASYLKPEEKKNDSSQNIT